MRSGIKQNEYGVVLQFAFYAFKKVLLTLLFMNIYLCS